MKMRHFFRKKIITLGLMLIGILANKAAMANEAIKSTSFLASIVASEDLGDGSGQHSFGAGAGIYLPIEKVENLGVYIEGSYVRTEIESATDRFKEHTRSLGAGIILRDSNLGGIGGRVARSNSNSASKQKVAPFLNVSDDTLSTTKDIKGEYYFGNLTIGGNYSHTDAGNNIGTSVKGVELTWYPVDTIAISTTVSREDFPMTETTTLSAHVEWQPESTNMLLNAAITNSPQLNTSAISVEANYYFNEITTGQTNTLGVGIGYSRINTNPGAYDLLGIQFGLFFDNRINLKSRDRAYLFQFSNL